VIPFTVQKAAIDDVLHHSSALPQVICTTIVHCIANGAYWQRAKPAQTGDFFAFIKLAQFSL
jgi:hypothetical protein